MGSLSIWHWVIVLAVVLLLFGGRGKISSLMGDVASGIKSFRKNMSDEKDEAKDASMAATADPARPPSSLSGPQTTQTGQPTPAQPTRHS
jgi:sec-independent protein translocase protein TatA